MLQAGQAPGGPASQFLCGSHFPRHPPCPDARPGRPALPSRAVRADFWEEGPGEVKAAVSLQLKTMMVKHGRGSLCSALPFVLLGASSERSLAVSTLTPSGPRCSSETSSTSLRRWRREALPLEGVSLASPPAARVLCEFSLAASTAFVGILVVVPVTVGQTRGTLLGRLLGLTHRSHGSGTARLPCPHREPPGRPGFGSFAFPFTRREGTSRASADV